MVTCTLTTNQTRLFSLFFSPLEVHSAQYFQLVSLSHQHLGVWPLRCRTLAFYMVFEIWLCYSTVWHFQRLQPLLVHLVPFDVNVSVFNMSFSGAGVRGLGFDRAAEGADWHQQSILSRASVIFSSCHSLLDLPSLINKPTVNPRGCRITVPADLWRDV